MAITKPVGLSAIATALGVTSTDLGTLCTSASVNKWARFKPIRSSVKTELTEQDMIDENFGFAPDSVLLYQDDAVASARDGLVWQHAKPRGEVYDEWYRQLDFAGYGHSAVIPSGATYPVAMVSGNTANVDLELSRGLGNVHIDELPLLEEFGEFDADSVAYAVVMRGQLYFDTTSPDFLFRTVSGQRFVTEDATIAVSDLVIGQNECVGVLVSVHRSALTGSWVVTGDECIVLPGTYGIITRYTPTPQVTVSEISYYPTEGSNGIGGMHISFKVSNNSTSYASITPKWLELNVGELVYFSTRYSVRVIMDAEEFDEGMDLTPIAAGASKVYDLDIEFAEDIPDGKAIVGIDFVYEGGSVTVLPWEAEGQSTNPTVFQTNIGEL